MILSKIFRWFETRVDPFQENSSTPPSNFVAFMAESLAPFRKWLPVMAFASLLVALIEVAIIAYGGRVIDLMRSAGLENFWSQHGWEVLAVGVFVLLIRPFFILFQHLLIGNLLSSNMQEQTRWRGHTHILRQSMGFFQNDFAGRLANRVMQQGPAVEDTAFILFEAIWFAAVYVVMTMIVVGGFSLYLSVPLLLWVVVYIWVTKWIAGRVASASERLSDSRSRLTGRVVDAYTNIESVKLFASQKQEEDYALYAMRQQRTRFQRFMRLITQMHVIQSMLNGVLLVGVMGVAIWAWQRSLISMGEVAAVTTAVMRLTSMSGWIMWVTVRIFEHMGTIEEGLRSLSHEPSIVDAPQAPALSLKRGEIVFDNVSHHYGKGKGGLDNLDLKIKAGERVGIVGPSGAGKSTLITLLLRFRDPEKGRILIDGQDIALVRQESLRSQIGMVTQDSSLLHRSIAQNLRYGRPDASQEEIERAVSLAAADGFISGLEDMYGNQGYQAYVGERGVKLSGGQRQRVSIARVLLKDAPIMILDEATSALDSEVEVAIQRALEEVMENKTVIAIAHRLSTIAQMDRIVVLDKGRIAEQGTHEELKSRDGLYARLWAHQSGGFLKD